MHLLRAATLTVENVDTSSSLYSEWLDYEEVEQGTVPTALAASWGCPNTAGQPYRVLRPSSGKDIYLRFVEGTPVPGYQPLRTYGWNAIEICVTNVLQVNERMLQSPFEIIGPPRKIEGLDAIHPMQVKGPDDEIVYLTQINDDLPDYDLPRAASLIDSLFILVLGASDLETSRAWFRDTLGLKAGREMDIVYTMIAKAYDLPEEQLHTIATMIDGRDVFLELDQYPEQAIPRPSLPGYLPPGVAVATMKTERFDNIPNDWLVAPAQYDSIVYGGGRAGTLVAPDGTLVEIVEHLT
jgi:catechol 2,3-dioxygenase-like lactoylglutathione lyase family enzyme